MLVGPERRSTAIYGRLPPIDAEAERKAEAKRKKADDERKRREAAYRNASSEQNLKIPRSDTVNRPVNPNIETINLQIIEQYKIQINAEIVITNLLTNYKELFERIYELVYSFIGIKEKLNEAQIQEFRMKIIQLLILVKSQLKYNIYNIIRNKLEANFNMYFNYFEISENNGDYVLSDSILNVFALSIYDIFLNITQTLDIDINQYPSTIINTKPFIIPYERLNTRIDMQFDILNKLIRFSEQMQVEDDTPILNLVKLSESILQQNHKVEETPDDIKEEEEKAKNQALIIERSLLEERAPAASSGASSYQGSGSEQSSRESLAASDVGSLEGSAVAPPAAQSAPPAAQSSAQSAPPAAESEAESEAVSGAVSGAVSREVSQLRSEEDGVSVNDVSLKGLEINQDTSEENLESIYNNAEKNGWEKYYLQVFEIKEKKLTPDRLFAFKDDTDSNVPFKTTVLKLANAYSNVYDEDTHRHCFIFESIITADNGTSKIDNISIVLLDKFEFNTLYFYV